MHEQNKKFPPKNYNHQITKTKIKPPNRNPCTGKYNN